MPLPERSPGLEDGMAVTFTDLAVERMRPPREGRIEVGDAVMRGLLLRVTSRGTKTWSVIYKVPGEGGYSASGKPLRGTQHRMTLGPWPALKVKDAREQASEIVLAALEGRDPRRATGPVDTVASAVERMQELAKKEVSPASYKNIERTLRLHVVSRWGTRPLTSVSRDEVNELLDELVMDDRAGTAREVRKHLSRLFTWGAERGLVSTNPLTGMRRRDPAREQAGRALSPQECKNVWKRAAKVGYPYGPAVQLLLLTGARKSEILRAKWDEIDTKTKSLVVPAGRYKSRRDHVIPFSEKAWEIVKKLPRHKGDYIFTTTGGEKPVQSDSKARVNIGGDWSYHDTRRTVETTMARVGVKPEVRQRVLGHSQGALQRAYNRHDYLEEKRAALTLVAEAINVGR